MNMVIRHFLSAWTLLTRLPLFGFYKTKQNVDIHESVWVYPLIGAVLGALYGVFYSLVYMLELPDDVTILLTMTFGLLVTGCFHENGLIEVADGFGGGQTKEAKLTIMKDARMGTYGGCAIMMSLLLKFYLLQNILLPENVFTVFILSESISRMPISLLSAFFPYAHHKDSMVDIADTKTGYNTPMNNFFLSMGISIFIAILTLQSLYFTMVFICICVVSTLLWGFFSLKQIGGVNHNLYKASQQINMLLILCLLIDVQNMSG